MLIALEEEEAYAIFAFTFFNLLLGLYLLLFFFGGGGDHLVERLKDCNSLAFNPALAKDIRHK